MNFHELDSIITRIGENSKIIFSGDGVRSDLTDSFEMVSDFTRILTKMESFSLIEFGIEDIVRSGLVKEYVQKNAVVSMIYSVFNPRGRRLLTVVQRETHSLGP